MLRQTAVRQFAANVLFELKVATTCHWYSQSWHDWMIWETKCYIRTAFHWVLIYCTNVGMGCEWIPTGTTISIGQNCLNKKNYLTILFLPTQVWSEQKGHRYPRKSTVRKHKKWGKSKPSVTGRRVSNEKAALFQKWNKNCFLPFTRLSY